MSVSKVDSADPVNAGTGFSYTVTVSNAGPSDATLVQLVDTLPAEVTFVSAVPDQGSCSELAGTVTCDLGTIADGSSVDVVIAVTVPAGQAATTVTNDASVSTATTDPNAANDSTSEDTTIGTEADVSIAKSDDPDGVLAGATLTYTLDVANAGPSDAAAVTATDTLPVGVSFVSAVVTGGSGGESCVEAAGVVTCGLGVIGTGSTETATIVVTVSGALPEGTVLTNNASVTSSTTDPDAANNADSEDTTIVGVADVSITKTDSADPVNAGTSFSYSMVVTNLGPSDANGVEVTDVLPVGVSYVSGSVAGGGGAESCSEAAGTVTCLLGDVVTGSPETLSITVSVDPSVADGMVLSNTASVTSLTHDPVAANDSDSEDTTVSASADISISKSDSADPVLAGTGFTYTLMVSNAGPSDAGSVDVTDTLPAEVSYVSATVSGGSGGETCTELGGVVSCDLGLLGNGASETIDIVVTVPADTSAGTITNNASVSSATTDPIGGNDSTSEDTAITRSADVSVSKVDSADPVNAGTGFFYTVTASNAGPSDATLVQVVDTLPSEATFVSATPGQGSCAELAGVVTCDLGTMTPGSSVDVVIAVSVPADAAAGTITNNASVSTSTTDPVAGNNVTAEDTMIATEADISVSKSDSADPVNAGTGFSYTVIVSNAGSSDATLVQLVDALPSEVTFVSATPAQGSCSELAGVVTCDLGTIAPGASVDMVIVVSVPADAAAGTITNNASVSTSTTDPVAGNNSTSEDTTITTSADVSVSKVDSADPVNAGTGFSYTVTVSNAGPSDATLVTLTDVLPSEVLFVSATPGQGSCSELSGTVTCALGAFADGGSVDIVIAVSVPAAQPAITITNNATITTATPDPNAANDAASEDTTIATSADVSVSKVDSADPVNAGTGFSYTVTVSNAGPSDATLVALTDTLPAEVVYVSATPTQGSCSELAGTVTCALGTVPDGNSVDIVIAVTVPADTSAGTITNNASVTTATTDPNGANDSTSEDTVIGTESDLSVSKSDSADPVLAGNGFSYTITVGNAGPSDAALVQLVDTLPAEVTFVSATPDQGLCSELAGVVTCDLGTLPSGASVDVVIAVTVSADTAAGTITNTASVASTTTDPAPANDSTSEDTLIGTEADISVSKTDSADPVRAGTGFSYTVTVSNAGPSDASSVGLVDTLPTEVSFVSATPDQGSCVEVAGVLNCTLGTIAPGISVDVVIAVTVSADTAAGTITNNATAFTVTTDPAPANDSTSEDTLVTTEADISVAKTDSADPVNAGTGFSYTVIVANAGPSDASLVQVVDTLPAEASFVSATPDQGSCSEVTGTVTCGLGTLAPGASVDVVIAVTVPADTAAGTITNNASVTTATTDPNGANDTTFEDTLIAMSADLSVSKVDSVDPVTAGSGFSYTITVGNVGPSDASLVTVTDVLPTEVSYVSATPTQGSCSEAAGTVTCDLGTIANGGTVTITIAVDVPADTVAGSTLTNNVTVSAATSDPVAGNDSDTEDTLVAASADLIITKSDSADPVTAGTAMSYLLTVTNIGPSNATGVIVVDVLPAGVTLASATPDQGSCVEVSGTVTCSLGTIADGGVVNITIAVTVDPDVAGGTTLSNGASVSSATSDPVVLNNSDSEDTDVVAIADVGITKTDSADPVVAGTSLTYTLGVTNGGPSDALAVVATDTLPIGLTYTGSSSSQGSCVEAAGTVTCTLGTIADGAGVTITIDTNVAPDATGPLSNTAGVATATTDSNAGNDSDNETTAVSLESDLWVTKTSAPVPYIIGGPITTRSPSETTGHRTWLVLESPTPSPPRFSRRPGPALASAAEAAPPPEAATSPRLWTSQSAPP